MQREYGNPYTAISRSVVKLKADLTEEFRARRVGSVGELVILAPGTSYQTYEASPNRFKTSGERKVNFVADALAADFNDYGLPAQPTAKHLSHRKLAKPKIISKFK